MKRIFAGIVTFEPNVDSLMANLMKIIEQVDCVVIIDNNSSNYVMWAELVIAMDNVILIRNGENRGIAKALNQICRWGITHKYEWVFTLDQDSLCTDNMISILSEHCEKKEIGMICPNVEDRNLGESKKVEERIEVVKRNITSGSLMRLSVWEKLNGFDEKMFIDGVDFDYCDRLTKVGYVIIRDYRCVMKHEIGKIEIRHFLFWKVIVRNHSPFRKYYIAKNIIYLDRKEKSNGYPIITFLRLVKLILITCLYENEKKEKLIQIMRGIKAGIQE